MTAFLVIYRRSGSPHHDDSDVGRQSLTELAFIGLITLCRRAIGGAWFGQR